MNLMISGILFIFIYICVSESSFNLVSGSNN